MKVKLKVVGGKLDGKTINLEKGTFLVGRGQGCDLRARSDIVSREHCEIIVDDASVVIHDLESKNGTFVNDDRIVGQQELQAGDTLQIGPMCFELLIEAPKQPVAAPKQPVEATKQPVAAPKVVPSEADAEPVLEPDDEPDVELASFTAARSSSDSKDDDISQWLDDDDDDLGAAPAREAALQDTDVPGLDDTRQVELAGDAGTDSSVTDQAAGQGHDKRKPGKLPPVKSEPSKDSGEAAASVLKRFSKRR